MGIGPINLLEVSDSDGSLDNLQIAGGIEPRVYFNEIVIKNLQDHCNTNTWITCKIIIIQIQQLQFA